MYASGEARSAQRLGLEVLEPRQMLAGLPELVIDINFRQGHSSPRFLTEFDNELYFTAGLDLVTRQVWRTDPALGAVQVSNITPSSTIDTPPENLTVIGETLYFTRRNELYALDNSGAGEVLIKSIGVWKLQAFKELNGELIFIASDGLWKSDGTVEGTIQLAEFEVSHNSVRLGVVVGSSYYFTRQGELWKSDGSADGTLLVAALSSQESGLANLTNVGGTLFLSVNSTGVEGDLDLWKSNGTPESTMLVKDFQPHTGPSGLGELVESNGQLFLRAKDDTWPRLWKSDGTEAGTVPVSDVRYPQHLTDVNGVLFMQGALANTDDELVKTDGTDQGTTLVKNLTAQSGSNLATLTNIDGLLYFGYFHGDGYFLWSSDGTAEGTRALSEVQFSWQFNDPIQELLMVNGVLYFAGRRTAISGAIGGEGRELWRFDGSRDDPASLAQGHPRVRMAKNVAHVNGVTFFTSANFDQGNELWATRGTPGTTALVKDIIPGSADAIDPWETAEFTPVGDKLFFVGVSQEHSDVKTLYASDGTDGGTVQLMAGVAEAAGGSMAQQLTAVDGTLYFVGYDSQGGRELWKSDGTVAGTERVKDVAPGPADGELAHLSNLNGTLLFLANDGDHGLELWRSDGTEVGAYRLTDLNPGPDGVPFDGPPVKMGDQLYFVTAGVLWSTDGTAEGTVEIAPMGDLGPVRMVSQAGHVFVAGAHEVWRSDGSFEGTTRIVQTATEEEIRNLAVAGDAVYFAVVVRPENRFVQLWRVTADHAGAELLKEFSYHGNPPREIPEMVAVGDALYFIAYEIISGHELWKSDGTATGTVRAVDLTPGTDSSNPQNLTAVNGSLFFYAWSDRLWVFHGDPQEGDYNADGRVDGADFLHWQRNFGLLPTFRGDGADGNADNRVTGDDLTFWQSAMAGGDAVIKASPGFAAMEAAFSVADDRPTPTERERYGWATLADAGFAAVAKESSGEQQALRKSRLAAQNAVPRPQRRTPLASLDVGNGREASPAAPDGNDSTTANVDMTNFGVDPALSDTRDKASRSILAGLR